MNITEAVIEQMQELPLDQQKMVLEFAEFLAQKAAIEKARHEALQQEILVGVEAANRGEVIDGEKVFQTMQARLTQKREQAWN